MNILFASSEIFPYAKTGGLADVAYSLPQELRLTNSVYTVMPLYDLVDREKYNIVFSGKSFDIYLQNTRHQIDIFHLKDDPTTLFLYNPVLCNRTGLYHDSYGDFGDNALRFGLFSYAIIETMIHLSLSIDTIHINDWQTALVAVLAKTKYNLCAKIILTIHNLAYQGIYPKSSMDELELDWEKAFKYEGLEYFDQVNFLKGGIYFCDTLTTVSPTYAQEIQTPLFGKTLEKTLQANKEKLVGILNGISNEEFNPANDTNVNINFDLKSYEKKQLNKTALCDQLDLEEPHRPLFIFIGRFTSQKGIDLLYDLLGLFEGFEANLVILGNGEKFYNEKFQSIQNSFKNIRIILKYDEPLARKLYASSDFLLMPSTFEPCGLNQMICMRYGCLPIVTKTGGLKDSVTDFTNTDLQTLCNTQGIGISFEEHNLFWFLHAISKALSLYANKEKFELFSKHNMQVDNSWTHLVHEYLQTYKK